MMPGRRPPLIEPGSPSMPRAGLLHSGEPPSHGAAGVAIVDQLAVRAGQISDALGVLGTERDARA